MSALAVRLVVPGELAYRDLAIRTIAEACRLVSQRGFGINGSERAEQTEESLDLSCPFDAEFVSAFSEIFNNIALYSYSQRSGEIDMEIRLTADTISITLCDTGESFDLEEVPAPELDSLPQHGMGIHIARAMVDELEYEPGPPNVWRLTKRALQTSAATTPSTTPPTIPKEAQTATGSDGE